MQIILLDKISHLGEIGDQIDVRSGYARNFLIPYGKAVLATKKNIEYFKARNAILKDKLTKALAAANAKVEKINKIAFITIEAKVGTEGKLFGSIGTRDIAKAIVTAGVEITRKEVRLLKGNIRTIGKHEVLLQVHSNVSTKLIVNIIPK